MCRSDGCICEGNWRQIVKESERFFGRKYLGENGHVYIFFGVVHGEDDYYYGLVSNGSLVLASCVGSLETNGYTLLPPDDPYGKHAHDESSPSCSGRRGHFCGSWDDLWICEDCAEFQVCTCFET